ncbi:MAG: hypothetical protein MK102_04445 [Fuerstiella sp.]|nr:hypothetical protein [Fuerstiella sp.]
MKQFLWLTLLFCLPLTVVVAQDNSADKSEMSDDMTLKQATESATGLVNETKDRVDELAGTLDKNPTVQEVSTGILSPIYVAAETLAFPTFYWFAFALMLAGVVNYVFQLVLGKLVVLSQGSLNIRKILSDSAGLVVSAVGLILTTQAATENSDFPQSPTAVVSATVVGCIAGLVLYRWNQAEEVDAAHGRRWKTRKNA